MMKLHRRKAGKYVTDDGRYEFIRTYSGDPDGVITLVWLVFETDADEPLYFGPGGQRGFWRLRDAREELIAFLEGKTTAC